MSHLVYIALGTNLGDRLANLTAALRALPPTVQPLAASRVYETPPWGVLDQPAFLNQVIRAQTGLAPLELLAWLKRLETGLGRQPGVRYGPRRIDLDILLYDDLQLETPALTIPHPRLGERAFVLVPLADLAPDLRPPGMEQTVGEMLARLDQSGIQLYAAKSFGIDTR
jgi:2-amino-4-hydroxy-6-hydroxymethyldihydropteridine diphosphokinase